MRKSVLRRTVGSPRNFAKQNSTTVPESRSVPSKFAIRASDANKFTVAFDDGNFVPLLAAASDERVSYYESRYAVFRSPEYQGFEALADGMNVDMSYCPRYVIAAPVRGVGALVKTGEGTLVMGKGRKFTSASTALYITEANIATLTEESGVVTVQNAGGVVVAEGAVEIEAGATDANSAFTVHSGAALDLGGNAVSVGKIGGTGTVTDGSLRTVTFGAVGDDDETPVFENVTFSGRVTVDFGCDAEHPAVKGRQYKVAKLGVGASGLATGASARAMNTGDEVLARAVLTVDAEGNVTAAPETKSGILIIVR